MLPWFNGLLDGYGDELVLGQTATDNADGSKHHAGRSGTLYLASAVDLILPNPLTMRWVYLATPGVNIKNIKLTVVLNEYADNRREIQATLMFPVATDEDYRPGVDREWEYTQAFFVEVDIDYTEEDGYLSFLYEADVTGADDIGTSIEHVAPGAYFYLDVDVDPGIPVPVAAPQDPVAAHNPPTITLQAGQTAVTSGQFWTLYNGTYPVRSIRLRRNGVITTLATTQYGTPAWSDVTIGPFTEDTDLELILFSEWWGDPPPDEYYITTTLGRSKRAEVPSLDLGDLSGSREDSILIQPYTGWLYRDEDWTVRIAVIEAHPPNKHLAVIALRYAADPVLSDPVAPVPSAESRGKDLWFS